MLIANTAPQNKWRLRLRHKYRYFTADSI